MLKHVDNYFVRYRVYLAFDRDYNFCSVAIYHINANAIKEGDILSIPHPVIKKRSFVLENNAHFLMEIYISTPTTILLNKKQITSESLSLPTMQLNVIC